MSTIENVNNENKSEDELTLEAIRNSVSKSGIDCSDISFIGLDDEFEFECQQCGACCMNRDDIILSPYDVYIGAQYLGITTQEFIEKYTTNALGGNSKIPMLLLATNPDNGFCPLLKFDYKDGGKFKCVIDRVKPGACRNHPIGTVFSVKHNKDTGEQSVETRFIKVEQCPQSKTGKTNKVSEWMKNYLTHEEEYNASREMSMLTGTIMDWRKLFLMTSAFVTSVIGKGGNVHDDAIMQAFSVFASSCVYFAYEKYDTSKPFIEQCRDNMESMRTEFAKMSDDMLPVIEQLFNALSDKTVEELMEETNKTSLEAVIATFFNNPLSYDGMTMGEMEKACKDKECDNCESKS